MRCCDLGCPVSHGIPTKAWWRCLRPCVTSVLQDECHQTQVRRSWNTHCKMTRGCGQTKKLRSSRPSCTIPTSKQSHGQNQDRVATRQTRRAARFAELPVPTPRDVLICGHNHSGAWTFWSQTRKDFSAGVRFSVMGADDVRGHF